MVTETGTSCKFSERRLADTMISSRTAAPSCANTGLDPGSIAPRIIAVYRQERLRGKRETLVFAVSDFNISFSID